MKTFTLLVFTIINFTAIYGQKSFGFGYKIENNKVIVSAVFNYGPSAKAGLQMGDVVNQINDVVFTSIDTSLFIKTFFDAKDNSSFIVNRNATTIKMTIAKVDRSSFLNICISGNCQNGKGIFIDKDGNEYNGEFSTGNKAGTGKMKYINGRMYDGNWSMNKPNGKGKEILKNGNSYEGNFVNSVYDGEGTYTSKSGITYSGIYKRGKFDGTIKQVYNGETSYVVYKDGVLVSSKKEEKSEKIIPPNPNTNAKYVKDIKLTGGANFTGYTLDGKLNGYGICKFTNGDVYEGEFKLGIKNGVGKYYFKSGATYDGHWENGKANGFGKYDNGKKETYEGHWKDGLKDGLGKEFSKNGTIIEQNWANGKLNGKSTAQIFEKGVLEYSLIREYVEDKLVGNPKVIYANGDVYEGEWQFGTPYGLGQFTYKNGDVAKGNFWSGKRMGLLEIKSKKGKPITQFFSNDTLAGTYSNGKLIYLNGDIFEGVFKDGLQDGQGKLTTKTETFTGNWQKGYLQGRVKSVFKADGSITTYGYKDGKIVSESFNAKKFTTQIINLVDNINNEFDYIKITDDENTNQVNGKLNGFVACVVKYYAPNISSTGKDKWVYIAETELMTKMEALTLCAEIEDVFGKIKFNKPAQKEIEYDGATRRLINYSFQNRPPFINLDAGGDGTNWTIEIRINK